MKIAYLLRKFPNLSQTFVLNQITGLIDRGHDVHIISRKKGEYDVQHACIGEYDLMGKAIFFGNRPKRHRRFGNLLRTTTNVASVLIKKPVVLWSLFKFRTLAHDVTFSDKLALARYLLAPSNQFDLIHCHFGPNGNLAALMKRIGVFSGKVVTTFHGYDITQYLKGNGNRVYDSLFQVGDLFLPISNRWEAELVKLGCDPGKIIVHHMGVETELFSLPTKSKGDDRNVNILTVGRLVEKKGVEFGIRAFAKISRDYPQLRYLIAGDGPLAGDLEQLLIELDVGDCVSMLGWKTQEEISELMKTADIILAPSIVDKNGDQEGIPVVLMEALAMGIPVLSTLHSGIPELVEDGVSGLLVPEFDVVALAEGLRYLLEHPDTWREMGQAGRQKVESEFDVNILNDRLVGLFEAHR